MEKRKRIANDVPFPAYPKLRQEAMTERGRARLLDVSKTSDGYLVGTAVFYDDDDQPYDTHSVFLGAAADYR